MAIKTTTIHFCDRCKKEFKCEKFWKRIKAPKKIHILMYHYTKQFASIKYDLCDDCFKDFSSFMGGRKLQDEKKADG